MANGKERPIEVSRSCYGVFNFAVISKLTNLSPSPSRRPLRISRLDACPSRTTPT
jgi:hypothetical protein